MARHPIPVIMFHSVRPSALEWPLSFLSCEPSLFEDYLRYLYSRNYRTVLLSEVMDCIAGKGSLPERSVALTFDDGYLDNWTIAAPLLAKYGYCGTIFVNPEFIDGRDEVREQWRGGGSGITSEHVNGMVSWGELKKAQASGIFDVQSHTMTHSWHFTSERVVDFHHPCDPYHWMSWNLKPDRKPFWLSEDQRFFAELGSPVYEHDRSLVARRYFDTSKVSDHLTGFVRKNGGVEFFQHIDWREKLRLQLSAVEISGYYESEDELRARQDWELSASKEIISSKLNKPVDFVCWPGGARDGYCCEAALRIGYRGWTKSMMPNIPGRSGPEIGRISIPILKTGPAGRMVNRLIFVYQLEGCRENGIWKYVKWGVRRLRRVSGRVRS